MLEVKRHDRSFNLEPIEHAIAWACERSGYEDKLNAAKNCDIDLRLSPLTLRLSEARKLLDDIREWTPTMNGPAGVAT